MIRISGLINGLLRWGECEMLGRVLVFTAALAALPVGSIAGATPKRPLELNDFYRLQTVENLSCSKDGGWIAYTVTTVDRQSDERKSAVWTVNWAGTERWRLTAESATANSPQFSPDGRFVSFMATRAGANKPQLYVLDRRGGEARALTHVMGDISDYRWSPDGSRIVLVMTGGDDVAEARAESAAKAPKPLVIDGFHFKQDRVGYETTADRSQLYLLDVATQKLEPLSSEARYRNDHPAWSPDGARIAFTSDREADAEQSGAQELYLVDARAGATPHRLARFYLPNKQAVVWMADGKQIAYTIGLEPRLSAYGNDRLALIDTSGSTPRVLTDALDRAISVPVINQAPGTLGVLVENDRAQYPALVHLSTGRVERSVEGPMAATDQCSGGGHVAILESTDTNAPEIYALERGRLRPLTAHNAQLLSEIDLGRVEDIAFNSADGTEVHGLMLKPVGYQPERKYPAILWIHGGPNLQDQHGLPFDTYPLELERQWFAAHGYVVLAIDYRGSSGRGAAFQRSIVADWGHLEVEDLLAGADYVVKTGIADPNRLGIGGWSYGGILTDYTIATDTRFKAAVSGAGSANQLSMFGADQYALQYLNELGAPWKEPDRWIKVSYPFFHADRIKTPTLFLGGEKDFNVPISGGEQMYQALRSLGVPTELVVYPGQYHLFSRPSYVIDRLERYLNWFDRYLKPPADGSA
jgi:dipeptidyl aminopeptidase/acylaminoacyl peptidase